MSHTHTGIICLKAAHNDHNVFKKNIYILYSRPSKIIITTTRPRKHCFRLRSCILKVTGDIGDRRLGSNGGVVRRRCTNGTGDGTKGRRGSRPGRERSPCGCRRRRGVDDDEVVNEGRRCLPPGLAGCKHYSRAVCTSSSYYPLLIFITIFLSSILYYGCYDNIRISAILRQGGNYCWYNASLVLLLYYITANSHQRSIIFGVFFPVK